MSIYKSAVKKPITTLMLFFAVIVFGWYSLSKLAVDLYPEIEFPAITVMTTYAGANASDIETNISKLVENTLNSVDDLKEITSTSRDNLSVVSLEFEYGTDLTEAVNNIRDALSRIESVLPENADEPLIFKFSSSMMPIMMFTITADQSYEGAKKILENKIINPLNRVNGIASASIVGSPVREISISVDPQKIESYNLTIEDIGNVLRAENINMPSGNIKMGNMNYPLRVEGELKESETFNNIVLGNFNGQAIYLKDVAVVTDSIKDMTLYEKINGKLGLRLMISKQSGANTVKVAEDVNKMLEKLKMNLPSDIEIDNLFDSSEFINSSISNLAKTLMYALIFVTIVVLFFLGRWRATFIIILTIPISLIVSFIYLYVSGNSINIISLSALSIAIGMVVDDAIVVLENISKHIDRGSTPREASVYATNEVWLAVIVTTLTVVAVFLPMTMIGGMTGIMFRQLGWIVTITVITSTITAITLTPMLSSKLLKLQKNTDKGSKFDKVILPLFEKLDNWYGKTLEWSLHNKWLVSISAVIIFILSLIAGKGLNSEFMPQSDQGRMQIVVELQSGKRLEKTIEVAKQIDGILEEISEIRVISTSAGSDEEGSVMSIFQKTGTNRINYYISLVNVKERSRSVWDIIEEVRLKLNEIPEIYNFDVKMSDMGISGTNTVDVSIFGHDLDETTRLANIIADSIKTLNGARNVQISRESSKPELKVELDREKMTAVGLNTAIVSSALYNCISGLTATKYRESGEEYNVMIRLDEEYRNSITDIENISLKTITGQTVKLGDIGEIKEYWSSPNIERKRRERVVKVSTTPYEVAMGNLAQSIEKSIKNIDVSQDILIEVGGAYEDQQEGFADIAKLLLLSLILVYIVMASQFESFKMPFIIMFSIPFAFSGVIFALLITNTNLSMIAALGAVMLIGIVVKNAIVLVDYINLMRDRGLKLNEAIIVSGKSRLRPVLMTAFTTILGMLPLALSTGEGSEIWSPMGISVIGGLVFSTIITMVIVPVMYRFFTASGARNKKKTIREKFVFMNDVHNND